MSQQQRLSLQLKGNKSLLPFVWFDENNCLQVALNKWLQNNKQNTETQNGLFIYGESGCGKTHLLQSLALDYSNSFSTIYINLSDKDKNLKDFLGINNHIFFVDGLDSICGNKNLEKDLFDILNYWKNTETKFIITAKKMANKLPITLPDAHTRLNQLLSLKLTPLDDKSLRKALISYACKKGWQFCEDGIDCIMRSYYGQIEPLFDLVNIIVDNFPVNTNSSKSAIKKYINNYNFHTDNK